MQQPQYISTPEGIRWQDTGGRLHPPLRDSLALLYDRVEGVLLKHGEAEGVQTFHRSYCTVLAGTTLADDLEVFEIDRDALTPGLLAEVNRAIQTSGYVTTLIRTVREAPETLA
jgi:hypothetical protein